MADWLERLTRLHHYHYPILAVALFVATVAVGEPGTHELVLGPLRADAFWVGVGAAVAMFLLSAFDEYDPSDYGLDREA